MNYSEEFKNLLPDELKVIKDILNNLITTIKNDKRQI